LADLLPLTADYLTRFAFPVRFLVLRVVHGSAGHTTVPVRVAVVHSRTHATPTTFALYTALHPRAFAVPHLPRTPCGWLVARFRFLQVIPYNFFSLVGSAHTILLPVCLTFFALPRFLQVSSWTPIRFIPAFTTTTTYTFTYVAVRRACIYRIWFAFGCRFTAPPTRTGWVGIPRRRAGLYHCQLPHAVTSAPGGYAHARQLTDSAVRFPHRLHRVYRTGWFIRLLRTGSAALDGLHPVRTWTIPVAWIRLRLLVLTVAFVNIRAHRLHTAVYATWFFCSRYHTHPTRLLDRWIPTGLVWFKPAYAHSLVLRTVQVTPPGCLCTFYCPRFLPLYIRFARFARLVTRTRGFTRCFAVGYGSRPAAALHSCCCLGWTRWFLPGLVHARCRFTGSLCAARLGCCSGWILLVLRILPFSTVNHGYALPLFGLLPLQLVRSTGLPYIPLLV